MLVVAIDLQPGFRASMNARLLYHAAKELYFATTRNYPVLLVEFNTYGSTHHALESIVQKHPYYKITKNTDDGSKEIVACCQKNNLPNEHIRIFGVHTDACVLYTIQGLQKYLPSSKIELAKKACKASSKSFKMDVFDKMGVSLL